MKSTGGWLPFRHEDKPLIPGQESDRIFTKEGLIFGLIVSGLLIAGGSLYSYFFGPYML